VKVPLGKLFSAFVHIGLVAFGGGGSAQLYQAIVLKRRWMEEREFLETTALCRILPGPVFANTAAHIGMRLGGVAGGALALLGVLTPGAILMLLLSFAYVRFGAVPGSLAESALNGVAAAAIGLILATMLRQAPIALDSLKAVGLALVVFVTYGLLHWQLLLVLLLSVPVGMGLYWQEAAIMPAGEPTSSPSGQGMEAVGRG
jgi:chromate transporter